MPHSHPAGVWFNKRQDQCHYKRVSKFRKTLIKDTEEKQTTLFHVLTSFPVLKGNFFWNCSSTEEERKSTPAGSCDAGCNVILWNNCAPARSVVVVRHVLEKTPSFGHLNRQTGQIFRDGDTDLYWAGKEVSLDIIGVCPLVASGQHPEEQPQFPECSVFAAALSVSSVCCLSVSLRPHFNLHTVISLYSD